MIKRKPIRITAILVASVSLLLVVAVGVPEERHGPATILLHAVAKSPEPVQECRFEGPPEGRGNSCLIARRVACFDALDICAQAV